MTSYGRDRRRRLSRSEALELYDRAGGQCQRCGKPLGADWHQSHLTAHVHGGATQIETMEAWCPPCNLHLGPTDVISLGGLKPRYWQERALPEILEALYTRGSATLWAGMGSGKTIFAAFIFKALFVAGYVQRLVYVVPNRNLIEQTQQEFARLGIQLDYEPRDGVIEHPDTVGAVISYQSTPNAAKAHVTRMHQVPTLVIYDEVHHLADKGAWGKAASTMVGDVANGGIQNAVCVLNSTGTLFRSSGQKRIAPVRYVPLEDGMIQAIADYRVSLNELIGARLLRSPDVWIYGNELKVLDIREGEVIEGGIADLDKQQRQAGVRGMYENRNWVRGFCVEAITLLKRALAAVDHREPLKILYVAYNQRAARLAADIFNEITGEDFSRLIISDEKGSQRALKKARRENRPCAIVTVNMVTEGFDCSHLAVEAYASNKIAELYVAQAATRTMRVTETERNDGLTLPASILIPDHPEIYKAFKKLLAEAAYPITEDDENCGQCGHSRHFGQRCASEGCACIPPTGPQTPPRYELLEVDDPSLRSVDVIAVSSKGGDGTAIADEVDHYLADCRYVNVPEIYAPRVAVISKRNTQSRPTYTKPEDQGNVTVVEANPREMNKAHRSRIKHAANWMAKHAGHDQQFDSIERFQWEANRAAGIRNGQRDSASTDQLVRCYDWMIKQVQLHCGQQREHIPDWARPLELDE